ncbi:unnamed protein product [Phytomonas sp. EM1]|nr:unnamed protein product [Phytomonas sp. EM1]|eukprot:CCW65400.1 unnamed protein product [Phytomonas sp. isolate EM1]
MMIHTNCGIDQKALHKVGTLFFVDGILRSLSDKDIEKYFSEFGDVDYFLLCRDGKGRSFGYGWLHFHAPIQNLQVEHVVRNVTLRVQNVVTPQQADSLLNKIKDSKEMSNTAQPIFRDKRSLTPSSSRSLSSDKPYNRRRHETPSKESSVECSDAHKFNNNNTEILSSTYPEVQVLKSSVVCDTSVYVCIPIALCPKAFLADPQVFCARMDASSPGFLTALNYQNQPLQVNMSNPSIPPQYYSYNGQAMNFSYQTGGIPISMHPQMYTGGYVGMQLQNPPPPGPPPNTNAI